MHLWTLYKKNFLRWRRYWGTSLAQILLPIILALLMVLIRSQITVTVEPEKTYQRLSYPTSVNGWKQKPFSDLVQNSIKDCSGENRIGGRIALVPPENALVGYLKDFFGLFDYDVVEFADRGELDDYIAADDYTRTTDEGLRKQLCFAVVVDEFKSGKYEYSFRFNQTNPTRADHWVTDQSPRMLFQTDSPFEEVKIMTNGVLTLQFLIDGFIFDQELKGVNKDVGIQKMKTQEFENADYLGSLEAPLIISMIASGLLAYLRIISLIVGEREKYNIENLESMGMSKFEYLMSVILFAFTIETIIGIFFCAIIKGGVVVKVNYLLLLLIYLFFIYLFITIGLMISAFFIHAKKAIIGGLIVYFMLYLFWILRDSLADSGSTAMTIIALSPIGSLSQIVVNMLLYENIGKSFSFSELSVEIRYFCGSTYFIIGIIELILFFLLGIYFFFVIPLEIGIPKHPLFFLGLPKKKKEDYEELKKSESQIMREENDFEEIEEEFIAQRNEKTNIEINNLVKRFKTGKVAVDNLNIEMFSNQIFALLGHNGAGKTTTISMISGFLNKTSGSIKIFGNDSIKDKQNIEDLIGICPQTNPIFDYMTVKEHLLLYSKIKKVKGDPEEEIETILHDIDFYHKRDYIAKNLSGGQKRKLCVALAFLGGSKIILLDEPTSGMDTYARRLLWEMIKKYKENRLIILTTHNMDEADYLGDRIGIMSEGKMVTCGSSLYLKNKFGVGYDLTIVKREDCSERDSDKIANAIKEKIDNATFISNVGTEMKFRLPSSSSKKFPELFQLLETDKDKLKIESFGTGLTTLEEVFLNVGANKDEELEFKLNREDDRISVEEEEQRMNMDDDEDDIDKKDLAALRLKSSSGIFFMQMKGLMKKRFIYFSRDLGGLICEIILPIAIVIIGLAITKISFINDPPKLTINTDIYGQDFTINEYPQITTNDDILNQFKPKISEANVDLIQTADIEKFNEDIFQQRSDDQTLAYHVGNYGNSGYEYTVFYNITAPFAPYVGINSMNNALLRYYSGDDSAYIKMNLDPMPLTSNVRHFEDTVDGFISVMLIGLAFSFIPASLIVFIIKERELNAKHQQLISGVNIFAYWLTNFIVDYIKYLIPALATYILMFIFGLDFYLDDEKKGMSILLFLSFGISMIGFTYLLSFAFKTPSSGQITIFVIAFLSSFVLLILALVLKLIESTTKFTTNFLEYLLRLDPFFAFPYGFLNMANSRIYKIRFLWEEIPTAFSTRISLNDFLYLLLTGIVFLTLIIITEYSFKFFALFKKKGKKTQTKIFAENMKVDEERENDVEHEENMVMENPEKYSVRIQNLVKAYKLGGGCGSSKKNVKVAVKGITFGVEPGTVFGLLGTNGAGKSSTFKVLTGDTYPSSGDAYIMNKRMPDHMTSIRHLVGYCPQFDTIIPNLTAQEHLELYVKLKGIDPKYHKRLIDQTIETLNLTNFRDVKAGTFSGGNKRKLSVAIAMIGKPPIIFLDEPSSGMDPKARRFMWSVVNDLSALKKHSTIILTTHSMEEAEALSTKLAIMVEGTIKTIGSVQQLKNKYGKCFEIEIKINLLDKEDNKEKIEMLKEKFEFKNPDQIKKKGVMLILEFLKKNEYQKEINPTGKGKYINIQLENKGHININLVTEWIDIMNKLKKIEETLEENFGTEMLESFQSFARFKVGESAKLSEIFKLLEEEKDNLDIANYSVKQISLEQIFLNFAKDNDHDE